MVDVVKKIVFKRCSQTVARRKNNNIKRWINL